MIDFPDFFLPEQQRQRLAQLAGTFHHGLHFGAAEQQIAHGFQGVFDPLTARARHLDVRGTRTFHQGAVHRMLVKLVHVGDHRRDRLLPPAEILVQFFEGHQRVKDVSLCKGEAKPLSSFYQLRWQRARKNTNGTPWKRWTTASLFGGQSDHGLEPAIMTVAAPPKLIDVLPAVTRTRIGTRIVSSDKDKTTRPKANPFLCLRPLSHASCGNAAASRRRRSAPVPSFGW